MRAIVSNCFSREASIPLDVLEKGDEVPNLVDSFSMEKTNRAPAAVTSKHRIECRKPFRCFSVSLPTPRTGRHRVVTERGEVNMFA